MTYFNLGRAVEDMWDIYGPGAYQAALESAKAAELAGDKMAAGRWRAIARECRGLSPAALGTNGD